MSVYAIGDRICGPAVQCIATALGGCISELLPCDAWPTVTFPAAELVIGVAPRLPAIYFFLLHFGAIQSTKAYRASTAIIKIGLFFILPERMKRVYRIFFVTKCISERCFVLLYVCDLSYFHVVLCPSSSQILATPLSLVIVIYAFAKSTSEKKQTKSRAFYSDSGHDAEHWAVIRVC